MSVARSHRDPPVWQDLVHLIRPGQWTKSLLVVPLPLLYPETWTWPRFGALAVAVALFVLASSVVYVVNDIADVEYDRGHPLKRHRPIASGRIPKAAAAAFGLALLAAFVVTTVFVHPVLLWPLGGYLVMNFAYSRKLKHVPLLDLFIVAAGFAVRVLTGYLAVGVRPSGWLLLSVFLVCFLPILGKRRRELDQPDQVHRPVLGWYSRAFLDQLLVLSAGLTAVTFVFFLSEWLGPHADLVLVAVLPLVLFGLFRYLHVVLVQGGGADPARGLLRDRALLVNGVLCLFALAGAGLVTPYL